MSTDNKRRRHRRRRRRSRHGDNYAAAHPPSPDRRSRSRSADRHRRRHSRSRSDNKRRRRSSRRRGRNRYREEENEGSAAYIVSDSDDSKKGRKHKVDEKWYDGWLGRCGKGYSPYSSSSPDSYKRKRRRRSGERRKKKRSRSYSYNSYSDSSRRQKRKHEKGGRRREGTTRRRSSSSSSSGNASDSSRDDTVGHFQGGPGTFIGEKYRIVRDVGLGTFGRVVECSRGDNSRVAIKIVRNVRRYHDSALIEGDICERVNREQWRQKKDLCAKMLDRFGLPSGHYCLVFERLGRSLYDVLKMNNYHPFPMFCVRDFSRQLLEALEFLHGFGLIHTDLKPENILLCYDDQDPQDVHGSTKVKVIDFGGATFDNEKKSSIVNTRQYRAPEVILGYPTWSYPSDLWSAGCIIAELYTGHLLFQTHDNAEHLALMEHTCGKFRRDLLDRTTSPLARECFDSRGWHRLKGVLSSSSAEHVRKTRPIERLVSLSDRSSGLPDLLRSLLILDPKERATARHALGCHFFR